MRTLGVLSTLLLFGLGGCSRDFSLPSAPGPSSDALTVTPASVSLAPCEPGPFEIQGGQPPFEIVVEGDLGASSRDSGGPDTCATTDLGPVGLDHSRLEADGIFIYRPGALGNERLSIRIHDNAGSEVSVTVQVSEPIGVSPRDVYVTAGSDLTLEARGGRPPYTFKVFNAAACERDTQTKRMVCANDPNTPPPHGTVGESSGIYRAGPNADAIDEPSDKDIAEVRDALGQPAWALLRIGPPLEVLPRTAILRPGDTQAFQGLNGSPPYAYGLALQDPCAGIDPRAGLPSGQSLPAIPSAVTASNGTVLAQVDSAGTLSLSPEMDTWQALVDTNGTWDSNRSHGVVSFYVVVWDRGARFCRAGQVQVVVEPLVFVTPGRDVRQGSEILLEASGGRTPYTFDFCPHGNRSGGNVDDLGVYRPGPNAGHVDLLCATDAAGTTVQTPMMVLPDALSPAEIRLHSNLGLLDPQQTVPLIAGQLVQPGITMTVDPDLGFVVGGFPSVEILDVNDTDFDGLPEILTGTWVDPLQRVPAFTTLYRGVSSGSYVAVGQGPPVSAAVLIATGGEALVVFACRSVNPSGDPASGPTGLGALPLSIFLASDQGIVEDPNLCKEVGFVAPGMRYHTLLRTGPASIGAIAAEPTGNSTGTVRFYARHFDLDPSITMGPPLAEIHRCTLTPSDVRPDTVRFPAQVRARVALPPSTDPASGYTPEVGDLILVRETEDQTNFTWNRTLVACPRLPADLSGAPGIEIALPDSLGPIRLIRGPTTLVASPTGAYVPKEPVLVTDDTGTGVFEVAGQTWQGNAATDAPPPLPFFLALGSGDLDGDGFDDLVGLDDLGWMVWAPGDANGLPSIDAGPNASIIGRNRFRVGSAPGLYRLLVEDLDGDGRDDLLAASQSEARLLLGGIETEAPPQGRTVSAAANLLPNRPYDGPVLSRTADLAETSIRFVVGAADLDSDGRPEIVGVDDRNALVAVTFDVDTQRFDRQVRPLSVPYPCNTLWAASLTSIHFAEISGDASYLDAIFVGRANGRIEVAAIEDLGGPSPGCQVFSADPNNEKIFGALGDLLPDPEVQVALRSSASGLEILFVATPPPEIVALADGLSPGGSARVVRRVVVSSGSVTSEDLGCVGGAGSLMVSTDSASVYWVSMHPLESGGYTNTLTVRTLTPSGGGTIGSIGSACSLSGSASTVDLSGVLLEPYPAGLAQAVDLDQDGSTEIVVPLGSSAGTVLGILKSTDLGSSAASFAHLVPASPAPAILNWAPADLDGDGRPEILVQIGNLSALGATNRNVFSPVVHVLRAPDTQSPYNYGP